MSAHAIALVRHNSPTYWATVALRDEILRKPLGLVFTPEELAAERDSHHVACHRAERLVGCLVLRPDGDDIRMRQVVVAADCQRQGIGTALVEFSESFVRNLGFKRMTLHARDIAVPFYERLGYSKIGERFEEVTIPHWAMAKSLHGI